MLPGDRGIPASGRLLVASPLLPDPNFDRTVVLLLAAGEDGAVGIVLNRPSATLVAGPLPRWEALAASPPVLFLGGPVQHDAVICLARAAGAPEPSGAHALDGGFSAVMPGVGTLDLDLDPTGVVSHLRQVRVFAGYAGWGPGQLEAEIAAGAWWVVDADPADAFCDEPGELWRLVLRRQGGTLALVANYPPDPSMN